MSHAAKLDVQRGAYDELHDVLCLLVLLREALEAGGENDRDADNLSSANSRQVRVLVMAETKLRSALVEMARVL